MKKILLAITSINWGQNGKNILLLAITSINWGQNKKISIMNNSRALSHADVNK
jgi:hypothetical protein